MRNIFFFLISDLFFGLGSTASAQFYVLPICNLLEDCRDVDMMVLGYFDIDISQQSFSLSSQLLQLFHRLLLFDVFRLGRGRGFA